VIVTAPISRVSERFIVTVPITIRIVLFRDDSSWGVGPHLGARRKLKTMIGAGLGGTDQGPALHFTG
jgi:hypothetical protein